MRKRVLRPNACRTPRKSSHGEGRRELTLSITSEWKLTSHQDYLQKAKALARTDDGPGTLWVVINSDAQAARKKGKEFMPAMERLKLVRSLRCVDAVIIAPDEDDTVVKAIQAIHPDIFAIGLDEGPEYMKEEKAVCKAMDIQVVCPLGVRVQSSTYLLNKLKEAEEKKKRDAAAAAVSSSSSPEKKTKA